MELAETAHIENLPQGINIQAGFVLNQMGGPVQNDMGQR